MSDLEQTGFPDSNADNAVIGNAEPVDDLDIFDDDDDGLPPELDEDGNPIEDDENEEVDYDGKKYKVHKDLKDALLRQGDYTKKTQELAEHRRAVQAGIQEVQEHRLFMEAVAPHQAKIAAVDDVIGQYEKVDWQRLSQEDPALAQQHWISYQQAKEQKIALEGQLGQMRGLLQTRVAELREQQLQVGIAALQKDIPNFLEIRKGLMEYAAKTFDFDPQELSSVTDPRYVRILHKAYLYDQAKARKTAKAGGQQRESQKPVPSIKGRSGQRPQTDLVRDADKMSGDAWIAQREAELRAKRGKK